MSSVLPVVYCTKCGRLQQFMWLHSLRGRRSNGKGKGIRARDRARGRRGTTHSPPHTLSRAQILTPATQASVCMATFCHFCHSNAILVCKSVPLCLGESWGIIEAACRRKNNKAIKKEKRTKFKMSRGTNLASDSSSWGITGRQKKHTLNICFKLNCCLNEKKKKKKLKLMKSSWR